MRTRTKILSHVPGGRFFYSKKLYQTQGEILSPSVCSDSLHPGPPFLENGDLDIDVRNNRTPFRVYVEHYTSAHWVEDWIPFYSGVQTIEIPGTNWNAHLTRALANANPYRPEVQLPVALYELKDIIGMIRNIGEYLRGRGSLPSAFLEWNFGWSPLIGDLSKIFNFTQILQERKRELAKLQRTKRLEGSLLYEPYTWVTQPYNATPSMLGVKLRYNINISGKAWYVFQDYQLLNELPSDDELALRLLGIDLNQSPSLIWEATPWSWLVDYFTNVGSFFTAWEGLAHFKPGTLCVMERAEVKKTLNSVAYSAPSNRNLKVGGGDATATTKRRKVYSNPTPRLAFEPLITTKQSMILGALFLAQAGRRG